MVLHTVKVSCCCTVCNNFLHCCRQCLPISHCSGKFTYSSYRNWQWHTKCRTLLMCCAASTHSDEWQRQRPIPTLCKKHVNWIIYKASEHHANVCAMISQPFDNCNNVIPHVLVCVQANASTEVSTIAWWIALHQGPIR